MYLNKQDIPRKTGANTGHSSHMSEMKLRWAKKGSFNRTSKLINFPWKISLLLDPGETKLSFPLNFSSEVNPESSRKHARWTDFLRPIVPLIIKKQPRNDLYKNNHDQSLLQDPVKHLKWSYFFFLVQVLFYPRSFWSPFHLLKL